MRAAQRGQGRRQRRCQGGDDAEALRAKLDYERQCYRHAEIIARGKLRNLQTSVAQTMVALKAQQNAQPHQTVGP